MASDWDRWLRDHHPGLIVEEREITPVFGGMMGQPWREGREPETCQACGDRIATGDPYYCAKCYASGVETKLTRQLQVSPPPRDPGPDQSIRGSVATVTELVEEKLIELHFHDRIDAVTRVRLISAGWARARGWSRCWWRKATDESRDFACEIAGELMTSDDIPMARPVPWPIPQPESHCKMSRRERRAAKYGRTIKA